MPEADFSLNARVLVIEPSTDVPVLVRPSKRESDKYA